MRVFLLWACLYAVALAGPDSLRKIESDHGVSLAISGMIIVFVGLASISLFIALLPKVLRRFGKREPPAPLPAAPRRPAGELEPELLTAIALALHSESERASGQNLKVTMGLNTSPWALSKQMRVLPGRIRTS